MSAVTVEAVAGRLSLPVRAVCQMVSDLCREHGPKQVVAVAASSRRSELTPFAVTAIEQLAGALETAGAS